MYVVLPFSGPLQRTKSGDAPLTAEAQYCTNENIVCTLAFLPSWFVDKITLKRVSETRKPEQFLEMGLRFTCS